MQELNMVEIGQVSGGADKTDTQKVTENASTAISTCDAGNLKSVSTTGFECQLKAPSK